MLKLASELKFELGGLLAWDKMDIIIFDPTKRLVLCSFIAKIFMVQ